MNINEGPIDIISLILKKYNEKFDENETEKENENKEINKIKLENELSFKKLLLEVDTAEKETKPCMTTDFKELFVNKRNIPKIHQMNLIQDINMVRNIVVYRKLEIKKQIRIVSLAIQVYKYVLIKIKCYNYFTDTNNKLKINTQNLDIEDLNNDKQKCINIFNNFIFTNEHFLQDTLCRYIELEKKLQEFSKSFVKK